MPISILKPLPRRTLPSIVTTLDIPIFEGIGVFAIGSTFQIA